MLCENSDGNYILWCYDLKSIEITQLLNLEISWLGTIVNDMYVDDTGQYITIPICYSPTNVNIITISTYGCTISENINIDINISTNLYINQSNNSDGNIIVMSLLNDNNDCCVFATKNGTAYLSQEQYFNSNPLIVSCLSTNYCNSKNGAVVCFIGSSSLSTTPFYFVYGYF